MISQHLSVQHTLQQTADYGNIRKYAQIHITQFTAAPATRGKLRNSCGHVI